MGFMVSVESGINALSEFVNGQGAIWLEDTTLGMKPLGFDGIEPGALGGQRADQQANALSCALDLLVVSAYPGSHHLTTMPGSIVPYQGQDTLSERLGFVAQPGEELCGDGTDGSSIHKAQPDLLSVLLTHEEAIASQGFRFLVGSGFDLLNQSQRMLLLCPGVQLGLLKTTPPGLIFKAQQPILVRERQANQPVTRVFLRAYAGSGLVIQSLARCQCTPKRSSAVRTVSSLTRYAVKPCSKLTSAASSSVQRLVSLPYLRGLSCSSPFRRSVPSSLKALRTPCGRLERR